MTETITLSRSIVEQAMEALGENGMPYHDDQVMAAFRAALGASQSSSPEIPEGWKLVPIEPTQAMLDANSVGRVLPAYVGAKEKADARTAEHYRAMLAAAPQPPVGQSASEVVVTTNQRGECVAVTRQDDEGRILSVIWEAKQQPVEDQSSISDLERPSAVSKSLPVAGVVIDGAMGVPALVKLGSEDAHIQRYGGSRLYTHPRREPLTQAAIADGFLNNNPDKTQYVVAFSAGVRFAERAHGIGGEE